MEPHNKLTHAETERLALLAEELGKATQIVGKVLRHGYSAPCTATHTVTNKEELEAVLGCIRYAMSLMCYAGDLNRATIRAATVFKSQQVISYLHHQSKDIVTVAML